MKKAVCAMLLLMLCVSCGAAEGFSAKTAYEARMKALDLFTVCALSSEYPGEGSEQGHLVRWESSIRVYIDGSPTRKDRRMIDSFLLQLALQVPDMPNITLAESRSDANLFIYFGPLDQLKNHVPDYVSGNWGLFHYICSSWRIQRAYIVIASDVTGQRERNHLIQEEIVGALGLPNDHTVYSDSILYQEWSTVQELSEIDWIMLNMVYSPLVRPGMQQQELVGIFTEAWTR